MTPKRQRLWLALLALGAVVGAGLVALPALKNKAAFFVAPSEAVGRPVGQAFRLGGLVESGSVSRSSDGLTLNFRVTDKAESVAVSYRGLVPDLFRENSGVIAEGRFAADGTFVADNLLAKHDEKYMPPEVAKALKEGEAKARAKAQM